MYFIIFLTSHLSVIFIQKIKVENLHFFSELFFFHKFTKIFDKNFEQSQNIAKLGEFSKERHENETANIYDKHTR